MLIVEGDEFDNSKSAIYGKGWGKNAVILVLILLIYGHGWQIGIYLVIRSVVHQGKNLGVNS